MSDGKRSFAVESAEIKLPADYQGRFESRTPRNAALKAARRLFKMAPKKKEIRFVLRETTLGSKGREFHYVGIKRKLAEPKTIDFAGSESTVTVTHEYNVRVCK